MGDESADGGVLGDDGDGEDYVLVVLAAVLGLLGLGGDHQWVVGVRQVDGVDGAGLGFWVPALE